MPFLLLLALACNDTADVALGDRPPRDTDTGERDTDTVEYEGDAAGECLDGADNDRDGAYDCDDPDCAGSPDCAGDTDTAGDTDAADTAGDTGEDTDTGGDTDSGDTGSDTGTLECPTTPATEIIGLETSCSAGTWTVAMQFDGAPLDLALFWQLEGETRGHDSRDGTLRLGGTCCETVTDSTWGCAANVEILAMLLDDRTGSSLDYTTTGPGGGTTWPEWAGPAPECP